MKKKLKILIIRFSSIGDIILTTPVIRCLKLQLSADLDFLTKEKHHDILLKNIYLSNIITISNKTNETINFLRSNEYDLVIDLQNNLRSLRIRLLLGIKSFTYSKNNLSKYILIHLGINLLRDHTVDRYFKSVSQLGVLNDMKGVDYFLDSKTNLDFDVNQEYICWSIGGTYEQKKLSYNQIIKVVEKLNLPIVFLGSHKEKTMSASIINSIKSNYIYDFCGKTSIDESALLMKYSNLVLTNDTGMMHIASAFSSPIISFWGCTKPSLGFAPYQTRAKTKNIITNLTKSPCSKHGKYCRVSINGCVKDIEPNNIYDAVLMLLK